MKLLIIPISQIYRGLRRGAARLLGEKEVRSLEKDVAVPVVDFINEVYDDTVGDVMKRMKMVKK